MAEGGLGLEAVPLAHRRAGFRPANRRAATSVGRENTTRARGFLAERSVGSIVATRPGRQDGYPIDRKRRQYANRSNARFEPNRFRNRSCDRCEAPTSECDSAVTDSTTDWRRGLDDADAVLLDEYQRGFPVREAPYEELAGATGLEATAVLERVRSYSESGIVRRLGPVLDPSAIGSSTLAALAVPTDEFAAVAETVNEYPEVSHNYRRDHEWNMWFVLTATSRTRRDEVLEEIATKTGYEPLVLPKRGEYRLDLQFPVVRDRSARGDHDDPAEHDRCDDSHPKSASSVGQDEESAELTARDATILEAIQDGLPLSLTPYADVADGLDLEPSAVVSGIDDCLSKGFIKRLGLVIDHHAVGFRHNCMVVWAVPEERIDAVGERAGRHPLVTKCYYRPRRPERGWEYTLFTMIHAREADAVDRAIEELAADAVPYPHRRLETVERLKQTGTRYENLLERRS